MKTEILDFTGEKPTDWSKPQWVIYRNILVFTNGIYKGDLFEGTAIPCEMYPYGETSDEWSKLHFKPIPQEGLTIKIAN